MKGQSFKLKFIAVVILHVSFSTQIHEALGVIWSAFKLQVLLLVHNNN